MNTGNTAFRSFGEFLQIVAAAGSDRQVDGRLTRAPQGASEGSGSAGGFLIPTEFTDEIVDSIYADAVLAPLCDGARPPGPPPGSPPSTRPAGRTAAATAGRAAIGRARPARRRPAFRGSVRSSSSPRSCWPSRW